MKTRLLLGLLTTAVTGFAVHSEAVVRYVSSTGSDLINDCTSSGDPCMTISHAIGQYSGGGSGDEIRVAQGTYIEWVVIQTEGIYEILGGWSGDFAVRYSDPSLTIVDGNDSLGGFAIVADGNGFPISIYVTIDGFTMTNVVDQSIGGGVSAQGWNQGGVTLTLTNNVINGNQAGLGGGVYLDAFNIGGVTAYLKNNMITGNEATGGGGGLYISSDNTVGRGVSVRLINNTISGNTGSGVVVRARNNSNSVVEMLNSIVWGNTMSGSDEDINVEAQALQDTAVVYSMYSIAGTIATNAFGDFTDRVGTASHDPLFVNTALGDYHLDLGSPAVDSGPCGQYVWTTPGGSTHYYVPTRDFEGDVRPTDENRLYCDIGADELHVAGESAIASAGNAWNEVTTSESFVEPIVIVAPPTYHGTQPGVVRLRNVSGNSFDVAFHEWSYLDGTHASETIPHLVLERGRRVNGDGSIWETGTLTLGGTGVWQAEVFEQSFPSAPALFLTVQSFNGSAPVTVRARSLTADGFEAALFEEESLMGSGHLVEVVGYLAIYSPEGSGTVTLGSEPVPYLLQTISVDERFIPVLSHSVKLEEERSLDGEVGHTDESLSIMMLGSKLFAQVITSNGGDTVAIRQLRPEYQARMEWGVVEGVDHGWLKVPLAKAYTHPVVVAKPVSMRGGDPGVVQIRNVSGDAFDCRYEEWLYLDGAHAQERVFYLVVEEGTQSVAGLTVEAGTLDTSLLLNEGWEWVDFGPSITATPAVFSSVQTVNGWHPVTTRNKEVSLSGFSITMDEEEVLRDGHGPETLGWIAIEKGIGTTADNRSVVVLDGTTTHTPQLIDFGQIFSGRFPVLVADMVTSWGPDTCFLRYQGLVPSSVMLFIQEEQSWDLEMDHTTETVSLFVAK